MLSLNRRLISLVCAVALISSLLSIWTILDSSLLDLKLDASRLLHRIVAPNVHVSDAQRFWTSPTTFGEATNVSTALLGGLPFGYKGPETLGIADRIYVLSLPRRVDRRRAMERLRQTLGLQWTYVDATDADTDSILNINAHIRSKRTEIEEDVANGVSDDTFQWPDASIVDTKARSGVPLGLADSDYWFLRPPLASVEGDSSAPLEDPGAAKILTPALDFAHPEVLVTPDAPNPHNPLPALVPLTCASKNYVTGPPFDASLPGYMLLTPAKIACWHSHLEVIQKIADGSAGDDTRSEGIIGESQADAVTLVLEDDIDMERDVHARLREVWGLLPADWDIVFLGHCWSNESYHPAIQDVRVTAWGQSVHQTTLHPSFAPKCTHAYALTRTGARRLLLYLRHTPFAYSRALDQAISWLILSGKLNAFSVVPSVVVQRKVGWSDIDASGGGMGSIWRDRLENGVLRGG